MEKPAGQWQTFDITLVDRHVTVVLNGQKIIDNQPLHGCTGGALWSDVVRPGPIYLQGDHTSVDYRNIVLRPSSRHSKIKEESHTMARPITLCTGQFADMDFEDLCQKAKTWGYDGLELGCWGPLFNVKAALEEPDYCQRKWDQLNRHGLACYSLSNHLAGQAVCDLIDERHKSILPPHVWGDGDPEGVRRRAAKEMMDTARAARKFFDLRRPRTKRDSSESSSMVSPAAASGTCCIRFHPCCPARSKRATAISPTRWLPILEVFEKEDVWFGLEVHPTEIAFDIASTERALAAINGHPRFGFNYDPSHFGYQHVDYVGFIRGSAIAFTTAT